MPQRMHLRGTVGLTGSLDKDEVVVRDDKKDRIVGVKARQADGGKVKFYCELDSDYCHHTAFAAALPQVRNSIRR